MIDESTPKQPNSQDELERATHLSHCYQGECLGNCKYGDVECPAKSSSQKDSWLDDILSTITVTTVYQVNTLPKVLIKVLEAKAAILEHQQAAIDKAVAEKLTDFIYKVQGYAESYKQPVSPYQRLKMIEKTCLEELAALTPKESEK